MELQWSPYLAVGVSMIDDQHIELFNRFNKLFDALTLGEGEEELINTCKFLEDYVVTHFGMEEKVMDRYAYQGTAKHREQHREFVRDFALFRTRLNTAGFSKSLASSLLKNLASWLINHIGKADMELGRYLKVAMMVRKAA